MNSKKIGIGLIIQIGIKLVTVLIGIFTAQWSIRNIPENQLADLYTLIGLNAIVLTVIFLGIPELLHKLYTLNEENNQNPAIWSTYQFLRIVSFGVGLILFLAALPLLQIEYSWFPIVVYSGAFVVLWDLNYKSITDAMGNSWQFSVSDLVSKCFFLILLILFDVLNVNEVLPVMYFAVAGLCSFLLAFIIDSIWQRSHIIWAKPDITVLIENKNTIVNLSIISIVSAFYLYSDRLFLRIFDINNADIVSYSNAYRLIEIIIVVPVLIAPIISSFVKKNIQSGEPKRYELIMNSYFKKCNLTPPHTIIMHAIALILFGIGLSFGVLLVAPLLIRLIDIQLVYPQSIPILIMLSSILSIVTCHYYLRFIMIFYHYEHIDLRNSVIICVATLLLYVLLIPTFGIFGAAVATVISYFADFSLRLITVYQTIIHKDCS